MARRAPGVGLGRTQVTVLRLLAMDAKSVRTLAYDGFGLSESSARSALDRLGRRGLVDRRFNRDDLVYFLTSDGAEVERSLLALDDDEAGDQ